MKNTMKTFSTFALVATLSIIAFAAVTFDTSTGTGFAGKGDVQLALGGLNNAQIQNLPVSFTYNSTNVEVSEVSWVCTNERNEHTQERARTTTVTNSISGIVSSTARVRNQITGYNLNGFSSSSSTSNASTDGPPINSCPNQNSTWYLSTPAGTPEIISSETTGGLFVNGSALPITN